MATTSNGSGGLVGHPVSFFEPIFFPIVLQGESTFFLSCTLLWNTQAWLSSSIGSFLLPFCTTDKSLSPSVSDLLIGPFALPKKSAHEIKVNQDITTEYEPAVKAYLKCLGAEKTQEQLPSLRCNRCVHKKCIDNASLMLSKAVRPVESTSTLAMSKHQSRYFGDIVWKLSPAQGSSL